MNEATPPVLTVTFLSSSVRRDAMPPTVWIVSRVTRSAVRDSRSALISFDRLLTLVVARESLRIRSRRSRSFRSAGNRRPLAVGFPPRLSKYPSAVFWGTPSPKNTIAL